MTIQELKALSGMNTTKLSQYFEIPYRTLQGWLLGERECPPYLLALMEYKLTNEDYKQKIAEIKEICNAI